ncbi:hypothetical protein L7F22_036170 [Adiantum nelumboides]|nr:hypothetical protein [Adiantum nelumboides]
MMSVPAILDRVQDGIGKMVENKSGASKTLFDIAYKQCLAELEGMVHLNPSSRFVIRGPHGDANLIGRKTAFDTYDGWGAHGSGAFSGKDPTKVDQSSAHIVRHVAKSVVSIALAQKSGFVVSRETMQSPKFEMQKENQDEDRKLGKRPQSMEKKSATGKRPQSKYTPSRFGKALVKVWASI